ncbi:MAG: ImmA/IrrE family metallo-endopeptidase [Clostridia bacterium]|nr:ImmA/IrrE family metallo-endopeptidase [Clostridia bacterium]
MQNSLKQGRRKKTRTSELYEIAEKNGTEIICRELPKTASVSVRSASGRCYVGIDPFEIETTAEERVHIAHEIGHCETLAFYNAYSPLEIRERQERRADRWAVSKLVPVRELTEALKRGIKEIWDLAEYFDVTEEFMLKAIEIHRTNGALA